jgi:integrase
VLAGTSAESARLPREHRKAQLKTRLKAGEAWKDNDLIFCKDDGAPYRPDYVTRRFTASLARDAEADPEIRRKTLGHADAAMTSHYTHIEAQAHRAAAEAVAKLVSET